MPRHIRHCVECPKCHLYYLIAFSPYSNGSHLASTGSSACEEYLLYCFCPGERIVSCVSAPEVKVCEVSKAAYRRGYGTLDEIWPIGMLRNPAASPAIWAPRGLYQMAMEAWRLRAPQGVSLELSPEKSAGSDPESGEAP